MLELPEVETVVRQLDKNLKNQIVSDVDILTPALKLSKLKNLNTDLKGKTLVQARRRGSNIILDFSDGFSLLAHMDLNNQVQCVAQTVRISDKTNVVFKFKGSTQQLRLRDVQHISFLKLLDTKSIESAEPIKSLGKEPLQISVKDFRDTMNLSPNRQIRGLLMDQSIIVGIGNIYADEVLFRAKIHPSEKVKNIPFARMDKLHHAIYHILELAILHGGTRVEDFENEAATDNSMQKFLQVYGHEGKTCVRCKKTPISKIKVSGSVSYICTYCQPARDEKKAVGAGAETA